MSTSVPLECTAPDSSAASSASSEGQDAAIASLYRALGRLGRAKRVEGTIGNFTVSSALSTLIRRGPMRLSALAEAEGVSVAGMSRVVSHLDGLGYVDRTGDPADGRACVLRASAEGERELDRVRAERVRRLAVRLAELDSTERETILAAVPALTRLADFVAGTVPEADRA